MSRIVGRNHLNLLWRKGCVLLSRHKPISTVTMASAAGSTSECLEIAVAGAHLTGLPLNYQLVNLGANLVKACKTAPVYKLYSIGPKPALIRQPGAASGHSYEVEIWALPIDKVGHFLRDGVKGPLGIGDVLLEDDSIVKGFIGEAFAVEGAEDISNFAGWKEYLAHRNAKSEKGC